MPRLAQWSREIERVRKLIRLHADHHHHAGASLLDQARQLFRTDASIGLVKGMDFQLNIIAEDVAFGTIACQAEERCE